MGDMWQCLKAVMVVVVVVVVVVVGGRDCVILYSRYWECGGKEHVAIH